jgi:hypothetical protein
MRTDWIKRVNTLIKSGKQKSFLSGNVLDIGGTSKSEYDLLRETLDYYSLIQVDERSIAIPNFSKDSTKEIITAIVADFKNSKESSRLVKPIEYASVDDIVVVPLTPDIFKNTHTWLDEGVSAGVYQFIPTADQVAAPGDYGVGSVTAKGKFTIDDDHVRIVITDMVDVIGSRNIQKGEYTVDNEDKFPYSFPNNALLGNVNAIPLPAVQVMRINLDWNLRVLADGDVHMYPWGVAIMLGEYLPDL